MHKGNTSILECCVAKTLLHVHYIMNAVRTDSMRGFDDKGMTIRNHVACSYTTDDKKTKSVSPIIPVTLNNPTESDTQETIAARNEAVGLTVITHDYCDVDEPDDLEAGTEDYEDPIPSSHVSKPSNLTELGARSRDYEDPVPSIHVNKSAVTEFKLGAMSKDYEEPVPSTHVPYRQTFV